MRFRAFLSYSHADAAWAGWLLRRLETYRVPSRLVGTPGAYGPIARRLGTFCRDRDELASASDLEATLRETLDDCAALIVVCSPAAAQSRWVNGEIEAFLGRDRDDPVFCFVVAGEPGSNDPARQCFPPALLVGRDGSRIEPLAADARAEGDGRERAFLKLVAGLLGIGYDGLVRREAQRRQRRWAALAAGSTLGMALALMLAANAWIARNDAQRRQAQAEDLLGFMLGDLRRKLTTVGRLDLMGAVDDKATAYFATLDPRDLSDRALEEQARSLTGIGQVRLNEGKHAAAMAAFREAHERSSALFARQPEAGPRLFDLAQAQYWIGFVALEQGRFEETALWFTRYRDSAVRLVALDPGNFQWQREVAYGYQNLAVLDERRGRHAQAETEMRKVLKSYRTWARERPRDLELQFEAANAASWLGTMAARQDRLAESESFFAEQVRDLERLRRVEPDNALWQENWRDAVLLLAEAQVRRGRWSQARAHVEDAAAMARALAIRDPGNLQWQVGLAICHWWQARLDAAASGSAKLHARQAVASLRTAHQAEPKDARVLRWLAKALNLQAQLELSDGDLQRATSPVSEAAMLLQPAWKSRPDEDLRLVLAHNRLLAGELAQAAADADGAQLAWREAEALLAQPGQYERMPFDRLELLAQALHRLGRATQAQHFRERLASAGYASLPPLRPDVAAREVAAP